VLRIGKAGGSAYLDPHIYMSGDVMSG
jgi:hypothetical protein